MMTRFVRSSFAAALLLAAASAGAALDPTLLGDLHWRLVGPFRGGRVLAVSGVPGEPEHYYFGSVNGGVWETRDAGRTWSPIFDEQPVGSIGALALAPSDPRIIYVGTGEADMRSDIAQGDGMYKSVDGGRSWKHLGLDDSQQIARIVVHPTDPNTVFVAALGHPYGPNFERGVFRSNDGGTTWQKVLGNSADVGAVDVIFEPDNPQVLYAAMWQTRRTPWSVYPPSNGPGSGLYKSTDGGATWTPITGHGFPEKPGRIGIAISPAAPKRVYTVVDAPQGGIYRSDDEGASWTRASSDARVWGRGWYFGGLAVEPNDPDVVYSCNVNLYRSADAGKTFAPVKGAPGGDDYHSLWIDAEHPDHRILGVDQGAVVSLNGGRTWSSWFNQPTGQFYHVVTDNRFPYWLYGAQQDSGAAGVPSRASSIDGINMTHFREITSGGESDNVAPDPKDPDILYGGRVEKYNLRTEQTQSIDPTLAYLENDRRTWTLPLVFSARDPRVLYFANQKLYRTEDGGSHWAQISPDLTRENPGTPANLDATTAALHQQTGPRRGVIYAIAPSRTEDRGVWVGTDDGLVWRTRDDGGHWENVTPSALTPWSKVGIIDPSHFDRDTAYIAVDRHRLDDFKPYIYRTQDGGKTWKLVVAGIPSTYFVNVVREDRLRPGLLYAGTERGMYISFDYGESWQSLQRNLPATSVRDIDVHGDDLVIATHGRAFWIMDDVSPLREAAEIAASPAEYALLKPSTAYRVRPQAFAGTPMPKDEPMAISAPFGAYIDYLLRIAPAQAVTLDIYNANDELVRHYSSLDEPPPVDLGKLTVAPEWAATPSTLSAARGAHRFVWPLRYPAPAILGDGRRPAEGVWAPPGTYKVVLTVDGARLVQPLTVLPDPRVKLDTTAYAEQFAFARQIEQLRATVETALDDAESRLPKLTGAPLARAVEMVGRAGNYSANVGTPNEPQPTTSLRFLADALQRLFDAVNGADAAPTQDARASFAKLKPAAEGAVARWKEFAAGRE